MIVFTTSNIKKFNPENISSIVKYAGSKFCLAIVPDNFMPTEKDMKKNGLGFWWAVESDSYIDTEEYEYEDKWKGGLVEGIEWVYSLSKPKNIAGVIYTLSKNVGEDPFDLWEKSISTTKQ